MREAGKWLLSDARLGVHALWFIWFTGRILGLLKEGLFSWDITLANTSSMDLITIPDHCSGACCLHVLSHLFLATALCGVCYDFHFRKEMQKHKKIINNDSNNYLCLLSAMTALKIIRILTHPILTPTLWGRKLVTQSCLTLCDPMDCSLLGSSIHGVFQARILEWVAISFSRGIFLTQGSNPGLLHCRQTLYHLSHQRSLWRRRVFSNSQIHSWNIQWLNNLFIWDRLGPGTWHPLLNHWGLDKHLLEQQNTKKL